MVHWVDPSRLRPISKLIGVGNRIRFEYEPFHRELYDNLRFTAEEAERTRDGLDVATLQLSRTVAKIMLTLRTRQRHEMGQCVRLLAEWLGKRHKKCFKVGQSVLCLSLIQLRNNSSMADGTGAIMAYCHVQWSMLPSHRQPASVPGSCTLRL